MTTPLIMLGLLVGLAILLTVANRLSGWPRWSSSTRGCVGVALVFAFTGVGHFIKTEPMAEMLPPWTPARVPLVYVTGVIELAAAALVLVPAARRSVGWGLIAMLLMFLPVNIYAPVNRVGMGGHLNGPGYLAIRIPLQSILIAWVWRFAVRKSVMTTD